MDYTTGINPKTLEKCTLSQACEYMAWGWKPVDKFADIALNYAEQRAKAKENQDNFWFNKMNIAAGKIMYWLHCKSLTVSGTDKSGKRVIITPSDDFSLDIENNSITDGQTTYTDIEIDFYELQNLFVSAAPTTTIVLSLEDDKVYLTVNNIIKHMIKTLKYGSKNGRIIKYVMEHPNTLVERTELEKLSIDNFDKADRIDQIFINAFPKDITNFFFNCTTDSAKFIPCITDIDIKKQDLKLLTIE